VKPPTYPTIVLSFFLIGNFSGGENLLISTPFGTNGSLEGAMKLWEYWASCRPVICTDIKSSSSYHHHQEKRYLAVEPENPVEMTDAIQYLIDHPEEKNKLAERGFLFVKEENSWDKAVSKIETIMLKD